MATPMGDAYCPIPMSDAYCATPVPTVPAKPAAHHAQQQQMGLGDADMTAVLAVVVVAGLALRWRLLR